MYGKPESHLQWKDFDDYLSTGRRCGEGGERDRWPISNVVGLKAKSSSTRGKLERDPIEHSIQNI
ncbi:hypothetical protein SADUNF_Sadunf07G0081900 [Salix dunnii]|uniref:Uncharacterized protein n=1 Tax=Salix dunnii TaxID=1413687 RepID=A0A835MU20_9ROSI|nr:hypothetical protein SADUNF_Sadunf07G0081900 [Salix dunnii]